MRLRSPRSKAQPVLKSATPNSRQELSLFGLRSTCVVRVRLDGLSKGRFCSPIDDRARPFYGQAVQNDQGCDGQDHRARRRV